MIDERAVVTAKFWEGLRALRAASELRESDFDEFALMLIGFAHIAGMPWRWPDQVVSWAQKVIDVQNWVERFEENSRFLEIWGEACNVLSRELQTEVPRVHDSAEVCRRILSILHDSTWSWGSQEELITACFDELFHRVVGRLTGGGYHDIKGICRLVSPEEIFEHGSKLVASFYLGNDATRKNVIPLLNSDPVLNALVEGEAHSKRIYVIGNNGEGKSILLADLADRLVQQERRVVGISFGLTDRFPFKRPKGEEQPFIYVGARTSEQAIALGRTSTDVIRMVRDIHLDSHRLDVFNNVVKHLGFGDRRYLVPLGVSNSFDDDRERYAELLQLTENANENASVFQSVTASQYALGLMRQDSQNSITVFSELSSGEQQLLILALKLTAYADEDVVMLVDEPELSLHVSWQRAIPSVLEIIGARLGCSIVVATHSPVIIASATHSDDQCFVARRHALIELTLGQRRSVETALFDGFQTYTANNRQVHERCAAIVSQAIQRLNATNPIMVEDLPTMKSLHNELNLMEKIIQMADSAQLLHAREDLELVAHTRAALNQIVPIGGNKL